MICIYCGAVDGPLSDEHIVPFGLAGHSLVLPKSSCHACGAVTGNFEQTCLRKNFISIRARLNLPTRRPRERPTTLTIGLSRFKTMEPGERATHIRDYSIEASKFPLVFLGLTMGPPGVLSGIPKATPLPYEFFHCVSHEAEAWGKQKGDAVRLGSLHERSFIQLLAKIAHSYAVAVYGYGTFSPTLLDVIFQRGDYWFRHWIGSSHDIPPPEEGRLISLSSTTVESFGKKYIVVRLRLFSFMPTPVYRIVAGIIS